MPWGVPIGRKGSCGLLWVATRHAVLPAAVNAYYSRTPPAHDRRAPLSVGPVHLQRALESGERRLEFVEPPGDLFAGPLMRATKPLEHGLAVCPNPCKRGRRRCGREPFEARIGSPDDQHGPGKALGWGRHPVECCQADAAHATTFVRSQRRMSADGPGPRAVSRHRHRRRQLEASRRTISNVCWRVRPSRGTHNALTGDPSLCRTAYSSRPCCPTLGRDGSRTKP